MKWLIVSWEHNAFWKPNRMGYTKLASEAGRYSKVEATQIVLEANRFRDKDFPHEQMVLAPESEAAND